MTPSLSALYRHPVKGFTPEAVDAADLTAGRPFPGDRMYAVEIGPSGFDPAHPAHVSKMKFTVLARIPELARAHTRWDAAKGTLAVRAEGAPDIDVDLSGPAGRAAFEAWLTAFLGEAATAPLRVLAGGGHRFMDDPSGDVSVLNLATVRDIETRIGRAVDPLRFRANIHVEGWPAWAENDWAGRSFGLGAARLKVIKPIVRCAATHVDPDSGVRDLELCDALYEHYGHRWCGLYLSVETGGSLRLGDPVEMLP